MPPKGNVAARAAKIAEDKTFGMKNKNKSKKVRAAAAPRAAVALARRTSDRHVRARALFPRASRRCNKWSSRRRRRWRTSWSARP